MRPIALLCFCLLAGCKLFDGTGGASTVSFPEDAIVEDTSRAVFADLHQHWETTRPARYSFTYQPICFCAERGPFSVRVEDGVLTAIVPAAPDYRRLTYDSLYARVADAYAQGAASVRFQYHLQERLLAGFYIDYSEQMADEEFGAHVERFTRR